MHLIQRMKIWKDLRRLEERAREEPSPSTFVDLGQVHINLEMYDKAQRVAEDGLALFPKSTELRQLLDCSRRGLRKQRVVDLRARLTRSPQPQLYREMAQLQLELGDASGLQSICREWGVRFPRDPGPWLVQGQAHLAGFYRDLAAREGAEAIRCLDRAVQMDGGDVLAHRLLGEVLYRIGAVQKALEHLQAVQELTQEDRDLAELLRYVGGLADHGDDFDALLGEVEEHGSLLHPSLATGAVHKQGDASLGRIRDSLAKVAAMPGVRKAVCIKGTRALVKGAIRDGKDPFLRIVRVVAKSAHRFARRLDIGSASKSVLDGDFGHICLCVYGEALAAVACDRGTDVDAVLGELQEIVAGSLYAAGGQQA